MESNQENRKPHLTLVGAGPGDPELITLKAIKVLNSANVVLYDALVDPRLLEHASNAIQIYCGKRGGQNYISQDQINELIVQHAQEHGHVVRLKGGDPFVFGRGMEEIRYAHEHCITTAVVPGLTSSISVPELQGIPVTLRGTSESFWVVTATTKNKSISKDILLAAQSTATVVILMGMRKLDEIVGIYKELNKQDMPIAIVHAGSTPNEKVGLGTIETIEKVVEEKQLTAPAIIIIGKVVEAHPDFFENNGLHQIG